VKMEVYLEVVDLEAVDRVSGTMGVETLLIG
jgi:hypothetical protein